MGGSPILCQVMSLLKPRCAPMFLLFLVVLGGCSPRSMIVLVSEPYAFTLGERGVFEKELSRAASAHGLRLHLIVAPVTAALKDTIEAGLPRSAVAIIDPLYGREAESLAAGYPNVDFILLGGAIPEEAAGNVRYLSFDRTAAFQTAGYAAELSIDNQESGGVGAKAEGSEPRIGVILMRSRAVGDSAVSAFIRGCLDAGGAAPTVKELNEPQDKAGVALAVEELRKQGIEIFFPRLGELNGACLAALKTSGGCAVTEDWEGTGASAAQVFLSVEEDLIGGIDACLSAPRDQGARVFGPVRVVCGKARPVPPGLEERITCK